jgi:1-phosphofructokinase
MKIATVTLNPAIDQTVVVDHFQINTVNRGRSLQLDAGGKGVNVASLLADYGLPVAVTGLLGADNPAIFEQLFARKGIADHFVRIPGATRTGVKIVDEAQQQTTDINLPGLTPDNAQLESLRAAIDRLCESCDWFVLAGNLPPGVPADIYATIIHRLTARGKRVALDTSQAALREGVAAGPTIVKPNIDELAQLVGHPLPDLAAIEAAARELLNHGVATAVISMGAEGALFVDSHESIVAVPPRVTVASTVGAGDAMVAGLIAGQIEGLSLRECARLATTFSVSTITRVGAHLPAADILENYRRQVAVRSLDDQPMPEVSHGGPVPEGAKA